MWIGINEFILYLVDVNFIFIILNKFIFFNINDFLIIARHYTYYQYHNIQLEYLIVKFYYIYLKSKYLKYLYYDRVILGDNFFFLYDILIKIEENFYLNINFNFDFFNSLDEIYKIKYVFSYFFFKLNFILSELNNYNYFIFLSIIHDNFTEYSTFDFWYSYFQYDYIIYNYFLLKNFYKKIFFYKIYILKYKFLIFIFYKFFINFVKICIYIYIYIHCIIIFIYMHKLFIYLLFINNKLLVLFYFRKYYIFYLATLRNINKNILNIKKLYNLKLKSKFIFNIYMFSFLKWNKNFNIFYFLNFWEFYIFIYMYVYYTVINYIFIFIKKLIFKIKKINFFYFLNFELFSVYVYRHIKEKEDEFDPDYVPTRKVDWEEIYDRIDYDKNSANKYTEYYFIYYFLQYIYYYRELLLKTTYDKRIKKIEKKANKLQLQYMKYWQLIYPKYFIKKLWGLNLKNRKFKFDRNRFLFSDYLSYIFKKFKINYSNFLKLKPLFRPVNIDNAERDMLINEYCQNSKSLDSFDISYNESRFNFKIFTFYNLFYSILFLYKFEYIRKLVFISYYYSILKYSNISLFYINYFFGNKLLVNFYYWKIFNYINVFNLFIYIHFFIFIYFIHFYKKTIIKIYYIYFIFFVKTYLKKKLKFIYIYYNNISNYIYYFIIYLLDYIFKLKIVIFFSDKLNKYLSFIFFILKIIYLFIFRKIFFIFLYLFLNRFMLVFFLLLLILFLLNLNLLNFYLYILNNILLILNYFLIDFLQLNKFLIFYFLKWLIILKSNFVYSLNYFYSYIVNYLFYNFFFSCSYFFEGFISLDFWGTKSFKILRVNLDEIYNFIRNQQTYYVQLKSVYYDHLINLIRWRYRYIFWRGNIEERRFYKVFFFYLYIFFRYYKRIFFFYLYYKKIYFFIIFYFCKWIYLYSFTLILIILKKSKLIFLFSIFLYKWFNFLFFLINYIFIFILKNLFFSFNILKLFIIKFNFFMYLNMLYKSLLKFLFLLKYTIYKYILYIVKNFFIFIICLIFDFLKLFLFIVYFIINIFTNIFILIIMQNFIKYIYEYILNIFILLNEWFSYFLIYFSNFDFKYYQIELSFETFTDIFENIVFIGEYEQKIVNLRLWFSKNIIKSNNFYFFYTKALVYPFTIKKLYLYLYNLNYISIWNVNIYVFIFIYYIFLLNLLLIIFSLLSINIQNLLKNKKLTYYNVFYSWQRINFKNADRISNLEHFFLIDKKWRNESFFLNKKMFIKASYGEENALDLEEWEKFLKEFKKDQDFLLHFWKKLLFNKSNKKVGKYLFYYFYYTAYRYDDYKDEIVSMYNIFIRGIRSRYNFLYEKNLWLPWKTYYFYSTLWWIFKYTSYGFWQFFALQQLDIKIGKNVFYFSKEKVKDFNNFYDFVFFINKKSKMDLIFSIDSFYEKVVELAAVSRNKNSAHYFIDMYNSYVYSSIQFIEAVSWLNPLLLWNIDKTLDYLDRIDNNILKSWLNFYLFMYKQDYYKMQTTYDKETIELKLLNDFKQKVFFYTEWDLDKVDYDKDRIDSLLINRLDKSYEINIFDYDSENRFKGSFWLQNVNMTGYYISIFMIIFIIFMYRIILYMYQFHEFFPLKRRLIRTMIRKSFFFYIYFLILLKYFNIKLFLYFWFYNKFLLRRRLLPRFPRIFRRLRRMKKSWRIDFFVVNRLIYDGNLKIKEYIYFFIFFVIFNYNYIQFFYFNCAFYFFEFFFLIYIYLLFFSFLYGILYSYNYLFFYKNYNNYLSSKEVKEIIEKLKKEKEDKILIKKIKERKKKIKEEKK